MTWKIFLGVGRLLCGVALAWMFVSRPSNRSVATILSDGRIEFSPNRLAYWAWPLTIVLLAWTATKDLTQIQGRSFGFVVGGGVGLLALMLLFSFPGSVVITVDGLEEVYWFRRRKRIQWKDIVEINTGEKSRTVTITGADGTRIVHSPQLPDRPRLLLELKNRCGENLPPDFPREPSTEE
jgi:hypothetical protein